LRVGGKPRAGGSRELNCGMDESPNLHVSPEANLKPLDPDYFNLQLKFADVVSERCGVGLAHAVYRTEAPVEEFCQFLDV
jgi:hypothetical protein